MNTEHVDVLIIGAGLSGIGAGCHLSQKCPNKTYAILEGRDTLGGTWDLFRYPGIRSDSDMFTLGYSFKPWTSTKFLADGPSILSYIKEAAEEYKVIDKITYNAQVSRVSWNSDEALWNVSYTDKLSGANKKITCNFINSCTGYYNYEHGYQPEFEGRANYKGIFIHPQQWPEDLNYKDKTVVVIGSGATAVTIVPEMAYDTAHITMLQRSPTYLASVPGVDPIVNSMRKVLPEKAVYRISRTRNIAFQALFYRLSRSFPDAVKKLLLTGVKKQIGPDTDMKHFKPNYNPWDERLCAVKNGDLFKGVKEGRVSVVTDHIDHLTENGIKLKSGDELKADIIISATGLDLKFFGGIEIEVDGVAFDYKQKMNYKGVMIEELPNIGFTFGYTNASWTLKADLTSEWTCRLLNLMDEKGTQKVMPVNSDPSVEPGSFLDFNSGYVQRAIDRFPKMGNKLPWKLVQNYPIDLAMLRYGKLDDGKLKFEKAKEKKKKAEVVPLKQAS
jgi:cation diffusion facilitator CzcD-associated flavoprotein CzcO